MIRSEYGHLIRTKSSGQIFTPSHSSALMGRCTGWWRRSRGCSEGSSPASSPASRDSSSASSSSSSFSPSVFAGVPTSYKSGDRPCWCPRRQALIISRAWTDQHLQPSVNVLKYIWHLVSAICWHINIQISHLYFKITQRHSWYWNCPYRALEQDQQFLQIDPIKHTSHKMK